MYNSMSALPLIPYNIMKYLATKDEIIWKLLAYNDYDALHHDELTFSQKMDLLWKTGPQEPYSVFLTNQIGDALPEAKMVIKIYNSYNHASDLYYGTSVYAFDCLYGVQMPLVDYKGVPVSRGDLFVNRILTCLNGVDVQGIGRMTWYEQQSRYDYSRSVIGNSKTFTGVQLFMSVLVGDGGEDTGCGAEY